MRTFPAMLLRGGLLALLAVGLAACGQFVKRDEFDSTVADLRAADERNAQELALLEQRFSELTDDLQTRFADYTARIERLAGRLRVDMTANFAFNEATLGDDDREALGAFAEVIRDHHPDVLVTVEGFTDPAGSAEYNQRLGMERAEAAREFLVGEGGLRADRVRAVSYGEDQNRQVLPGQWGEGGAANRRVALVIDHVPG